MAKIKITSIKKTTAVATLNMQFDSDNPAFKYATELINNKEPLIYLTGKAGTGKTTFLKHLKETTKKNLIVVAPTGVAAINAGGVTINSFFQIPFGPFLPEDARLRTMAVEREDDATIFSTFLYGQERKNIINKMELLIIDEVSMVRADTVDVIDKILRAFRGKPDLPFGGVQVIFIGDAFQLPPIANKEEWPILKEFYKSPFFFSSMVIVNNTPKYVELKKIYRQNDQTFIDLLNRVRINETSKADIDLLNTKLNPNFSGNGGDYITLATHNKIVSETNTTKLKELKTQIFAFEAKTDGVFPDKHKPTDDTLLLKVGAQVMFVKNNAIKKYFNGKIGKVKTIKGKNIIVQCDNGEEFWVEQDTWENIKYVYNKKKKTVEKEVVGTFTQFPLRLAWAITVHKSQGLTFEKVIADLQRAFAPGQVYVALSRCTSLDGLILKSHLFSSAIKTDPHVIEFAKNEARITLKDRQVQA